MARVGRMEIEKDGERTVFARTWRVLKAADRVYYGLLLLLAGSGALAFVIDDEAVLAVGGILLGIVVIVFGLVATMNDVTYGGALRLVKDRLVVHPRPGEGTGYRAPPEPPHISVDGDKLPLDALREVVVGHIEIHGQYGTQHMYPVYVVLDDEAVEVINHNKLPPSREVARALADAVEVPMSERYTGQVVGGGAIALLVVFIVAQILVMVVGAVPFAASDDITVRVAAPAALAGALMLSNLLFAWAAARFIRRSADKKVRAIFRFESGPPAR